MLSMILPAQSDPGAALDNYGLAARCCFGAEDGSTMKKTYEKPELHTEPFDVEDVTAASGGFLQTVGEQFENLIGDLADMIISLGQ